MVVERCWNNFYRYRFKWNDIIRDIAYDLEDEIERSQLVFDDI